VQSLSPISRECHSSPTTDSLKQQMGSDTYITAMSMVVSRTLAATELVPLTKENLSVALRDRSKSLEDIAAVFGVSVRTIGKRAVAWGIPKRVRKSLCPQKAEITRDKLEPLWADPAQSIQGIAKRFNVNSHTLKTVAEEYELGPKPANDRQQAGRFTREKLEELWTSHTTAEIAAILKCAEKTVRRWGREWNLPSRWRPDPTEEEIYAMAAEIRKSWPIHRLR
jgi:DNA-binding CsgD family transcriptional regulator